MRKPALALLGPALLVIAIVTESTALAAPLVDWDRNADRLVLSYSETSDKLTTPLTVRLQLFGDGRLVVTRPEGFVAAGTRELRLQPAEVQQVLSALVSSELVAFDVDRVRDQLRDERQQRRRAALAAGMAGPAVHETSEQESRLLELNLTRFSPEARGLGEEVNLVIPWIGLQQHLREFPQNASVGALGHAVAELRALLDRPELGGR